MIDLIAARWRSEVASGRTKRALRFVAWALPALLLLLPLAVPTLRAAQVLSFAALGRDQGIFQYIAWAISRGAVDYRDIRDVNGPLIHAIHAVFLALGGADEHRFRLLDLGVTGASFFFAGWCLPGLTRKAPRPPWPRRGAHRIQLLWGLIALVALGSQYVRYLPWDLAQRESFCNWFLLPALALGWTTPRQGFGARAHPCGSGLLLGLTCFGKPTYVVFVLAELLTLLLARDRARRVLWFFVGIVSAAILALLYLLAYGDVGAFLRIYLVDARIMYRFIWPHTPAEILAMPWARGALWTAFVPTLLLTGLIFRRELSPRFLTAAWMAPLGLVSVLLQKKGFLYHFHPHSLGVALEILLLLAWANERALARPGRRAWTSVLGGALAAATYSIAIVVLFRWSPAVLNPWMAELGKTAEGRVSREYLDKFALYDFFPFELREAAAYLRDVTPAEGRIQIYGMDPYLLFLAHRKSATPYIYAYDLNADAAYHGALDTSPDDEAEANAARVLEIVETHWRDLQLKVEKERPAAFVFIDRAPLISQEDAFADFREHGPKTSAWVEAHYEPRRDFGKIHVWLPKGETP